MSIRVGIDLGTTNSVCAMSTDKRINYIKIDNSFMLPSCLYDDGKIKIVGNRAKSRGQLHPENYISSSKRKMEDSQYSYTIGKKTYSPEDVATEILKKIYEEVKKQTQETEIDAVITIPAIFRDYAIGATIRAGHRAGFHQVTTLKEPISSVIAHGIQSGDNGNYMVVDLGGGTLDISIVKVDNQKYNTLNVGGDSRLGGDDFTKIIQDMIEEEILLGQEYGYLDFSVVDIYDNAVLQEIFKDNETYLRVKQNILQHAEEAKIALSYENETIIDIPHLYKRNDQMISFQMKITRQNFEKKAERLFQRFRDSIQDALQSVYQEEGISKDDIDKIIFAGGSMNLLKAKQIVQDIFNKKPLDKDLDLIVAQGAALYSGTEGPDPIEVINRLPYNLGIEIYSKELHPIIKKGTRFPADIEETNPYFTVEDNQVSILFSVYEGNYLAKAADPQNKKIYEFTMYGLRPQPKGEACVRLTFSLNKEGMLHIHAQDVEGIAPAYDNSINWNEYRKVEEE